MVAVKSLPVHNHSNYMVILGSLEFFLGQCENKIPLKPMLGWRRWKGGGGGGRGRERLSNVATLRYTLELLGSFLGHLEKEFLRSPKSTRRSWEGAGASGGEP